MEPGELAAALESIGVYSPDKCAELQAAGVDASDEAVVLDYDVRGILPACGAMIYEGESLEHANIAARLAASLSPEARAAAAALLGQETAPTLLEACNAFAQADEIGYMEYDVPEYLSAAPREAKLGFTLAHGEPGPDGRTLAEVLAAYGASACMDWQRYGAERAQDWALSDAGAIPADRRIDLEAIGWDEAREKAFGPTPSADRARARREPISGRGPRAAAEQAARPKADRRGAAATPKADKAAVKAQTR